MTFIQIQPVMNGPEQPAVSFICFGNYFLMTLLNFLEDKI